MRTEAQRALSARTALAFMVVILLLAAALRTMDLSLMRDMLHYDEAYYGLDAQSLLNSPRLTPFFPENFGRESLWMYLLTPALAVFGAEAWGLRLTSAFVGLLTVAAVYRLGHTLWGRRAGVGSAAALAVLFWHVLASHQAFRAHLYPLMGALAFAALWHAIQHHQRSAWAIAGIGFGLLAYTYIGARGWLILAVAILTWVLIRRPQQRRDAWLSLSLALLISGPLWVYLAMQPAQAAERAAQVSISSVEALFNNLGQWAAAWWFSGSADPAYNLPARPILDLPLTLLGFGVIIFARARQRIAWPPLLWVVLLFLSALAPAVLTTDTLKPLRAVGVWVPLSLVIGLGAAGLWQLRAPQRWQRIARWLWTLGLILLAGLNSAADFSRWVRSPDLFLPMEQHIMSAVRLFESAAPPDVPLYFSPFSPQHPVLRFRQPALSDHPVSAFVPNDCLRLSDAPESIYFALTFFETRFAEQLAPWRTLSRWDDEPTDARYEFYRAVPLSNERIDDWVDFEGGISVALAQSPDPVGSGNPILVTLLLRAHQLQTRDLTLFLHVYGEPTPYEGGRLWGQADAPLCPGSPPNTWRADETIVQSALLSTDSTMMPGTYALALGIYDRSDNSRLSIAAPAADNYAIVSSVIVR